MSQETRWADDSFVYRRDGAQRFRGVVSKEAVNDLIVATDHVAMDRAGTRLYGVGSELRAMLSISGPVGSLVAAIQGPATKPVRAILFDKTPTTNWTLGWHQDRTIAVAERIEVSGFGPWTVKDGGLHVAPPYEILADMITVRVHIDSVDLLNAPLLIAPGSHRLGRLPESKMAEVVQECGIHACLADVGDIWVYATPVLHASKAAERPSRRRVLQVDYASRDLPGGLRWLGI